MKAAVSFEAIKLELKQNARGHVLTLAIHPNDTPDALWRTPTGTRYGVALVELNEEDAAYEDTMDGEKAMKMLGARARELDFQRWVFRKIGDASERLLGDPERRARDAVKFILDIASSAEIRDNPEVRKKFQHLMAEYDNSNSRRSHHGVPELD